MHPMPAPIAVPTVGDGRAGDFGDKFGRRSTPVLALLLWVAPPSWPNCSPVVFATPESPSDTRRPRPSPGGLTPVFAVALLEQTGSHIPVAAYAAVMMGIAFAGLMLQRNRTNWDKN